MDASQPGGLGGGPVWSLDIVMFYHRRFKDPREQTLELIQLLLELGADPTKIEKYALRPLYNEVMQADALSVHETSDSDSY